MYWAVILWVIVKKSSILVIVREMFGIDTITYQNIDFFLLYHPVSHSVIRTVN